MRVMHQILTPGVQNCDEADLGTQMLGIAGNGPKRLGGGAKQDVVHNSLVLARDRRNLLRHSEDDMEILNRQ